MASQSYLSLWYHLVCSTKNREPFIDKSWKWQLYDHIRVFCKQKEYHLDIINGTEDHIHLLISPKPVFSLSNVVRDIKRDSYYWVKEQNLCSTHFSWQDGYGRFAAASFYRK